MHSPTQAFESLKQLIAQKDRRIKELETQLKLANLRIQKLENPERKRFSRVQSSSLPASEEIQVTAKDISFSMKESLDTAHIAHLSSLKASKPKSSDFKLRIPKIAESKQKTSESSQGKKPADSGFFLKLDELIFANNYDKSAWNSTLTNFRKDPKLLSKVIHTAKGGGRRESMTRASRSRKSEGNISNFEEFRPISANIERKWKDVDWSQTTLDTYASRGIFEFNYWKDAGFFTPGEVEVLIKQGNFDENWEVLFNKGIKTLDRLIQELMLQKGYFVIPLKNVENLGIILKECDKLFRARALVMKILSAIHKREDLLLKIMRYDQEDEGLNKNYYSFSQISQDILQSIGFLSQVGVHLAEFWYLGGNYAEKVLQDDINIKELFPGLKEPEDL